LLPRVAVYYTLDAVPSWGCILRTSKLIYIALSGATIALLVGVGLFFAPFGVSQNLANRGTAAAALVSGFAVVMTALALVATVRVESSDFRAEERVKEDLARLLASLRSIYLKAAWLTQQQDQMDSRHASLFDGEREVLQGFLNSTTASAFYALEGRKSAESGSRPEEWRVFSLYVIDILRSPMPKAYQLVARRAVRAEHLLTQLRREDIAALSADVSDLAKAVEDFDRHRSETVLARAAYEAYGGEDDEEAANRSAMDRFKELKSRGIEDPDIDLFLGVDLASVQKAVDAGANVNVTIGEVLSRYENASEAGPISKPD
jgi:hypothetical protein